METITNRQIIECMHHLTRFTPDVSLVTQIRMDRNLRQFVNFVGEYEMSKSRAQWAVKKDQTKAATRQDGNADLTPEEQTLFLNKHEELLNTHVSIDLHPIYLIKDANIPADKTEDFVINLAHTKISNEIRSCLLDIMFKTDRVERQTPKVVKEPQKD